ncbi:hypothetical protein AP058_01217 [Flavobacterium sp. TAB 87]|nr:hypothetical protein AP058_01217 [Flavobacterium sp. TAB 87]
MKVNNHPQTKLASKQTVFKVLKINLEAIYYMTLSKKMKLLSSFSD